MTYYPLTGIVRLLSSQEVINKEHSSIKEFYGAMDVARLEKYIEVISKEPRDNSYILGQLKEILRGKHSPSGA